MKPSWKAPTITRIVCPALALAIVISTQHGRIKFENLTIKRGVTAVSPAGMVIKRK